MEKTCENCKHDKPCDYENHCKECIGQCQKNWEEKENGQ